MKILKVGKWPDKPMSVAVLKSVLREKITGDPDQSVRKFCREKMAEITQAPCAEPDPDSFLSCC